MCSKGNQELLFYDLDKLTDQDTEERELKRVINKAITSPGKQSYDSGEGIPYSSPARVKHDSFPCVVDDYITLWDTYDCNDDDPENVNFDNANPDVYNWWDDERVMP